MSTPPTTPGLMSQLQQGRILTGMQCFSGSPVLVEAMGAAGLDFVIIDMEHTSATLETVAHLLRATGRSAITPLVRVPELDASTIGRVLDLGAAGVVVPHASPHSARDAVRFSRYEPSGSRSACPVIRAANYMPADWQQHASQANNTVLVVPLIEDAGAIDEVEAILDTDGVEVVFVGPFDLSMSMGLPGSDYRHPQLAAALKHVVQAAQSRGKYVMTTVGGTIDREYAAMLINSGVRLMSFSADVAVFLTACKGIAALGGKA